MKSIIITGASQGIGRATAELFLATGWTVGLLARSADKLEAIAQTNPNAIVLQADVTDETALADAFSMFVGKVGRLDALFNNAGLFGPAGPIDQVPLTGFDEVMNVNVRGMFIAAQLAFAEMRKQAPQGGRIINNGSLSAHVPREGSVCYTMSKHAITGLTRTLSLDGREHDIACGQIDIGNAATDMVSGLNDALIADGKDPIATMDVNDAARSVLHMAEMPLASNVQFMTVMATKMPFIGRG
ncbi:NADP-dependent 3-hydroxy acid dehydrogenase YdfG [Shimia isoporae]|uniref:NADP-dependent 3-hydroxy acid dehydrogenase YdfG n=1 Tax=Shimia isoporae TaxID=647720 RepID=A0A4R1NTG5_9RHOB|nr:SDR family oxidoreductase [Shimia isoporae]TCL08568.1 NADP-dependent 3-hydroxy acid dehydrogenase YdfG [Shimia isoporae]